jgi:membrane fusion protein, copper/silver efflux system
VAEKTGDGPRSSGRFVLHELWAFLRIMNVRLRFIFLMVLVGVIAGHWESIMNHYDRWRRPAVASAMVQEQPVEYFCPMHPNILRASQGSCPICGMPLSRRARTGGQVLPEGVLSRVELTPLKVEMGRIGTTPVACRLLSREIRTVGVVDYDETKLAYISARIKGRIDELMVNYVGQHIKKGDPLVSIYSPDLLVAQKDLLSAERRAEVERKSVDSTGTARAMADAARQKLILWGITSDQVDQLVRRGTPETHLTLFSPIGGIVTEKNVLVGDYVTEGTRIYTIADLTTVWMQAKVFEDQIAGVSVGTAVEVISTAYPNEIFAGRITFIAYTVDPATRTVAARVEVVNPDLKLKPGMYVYATIRLPVGKVTELAPTSKPAPAASRAATQPGVDTAPLARACLAMAAAYAHDKTDAQAVSRLLAAASPIAEHGPEAVRPGAKAIVDAAESARAGDLKAQREAFKAISSATIDLLKRHPPAGLKLFVAYCPMVKASWLTEVQEVANPYYGSEMFACGEIKGPLPTSATASDEQFATGYYCPIYPDRLFEKTHLCPIDKFPMKYARVEKVLAVPESAVVNTGIRKVVYRESAPGTFDMIEVKVGPRAGEFYPVVSGLEPGDKVATAGAFLVDAENRLNPAASVQYFGATGGPGGSGTTSGEHKH